VDADPLQTPTVSGSRMKTEDSAFVPTARREGMITKEVDGELLIYDRDRDRAHCLNPTAALIWRRCNGGVTIAEIAGSVSMSLGVRVDEQVVYFALKQFSRAHLLVESQTSKFPSHLSRRALIRRVGVSVTLLPLLTSLSAPTAQAAISCGGACTGGPGRGSCSPGCLCSVITDSCVAA